MEAELRMLIFSPGALGHRPLKHSSAGIGSCARNAGVQHTSAKARTAPLLLTIHSIHEPTQQKQARKLSSASGAHTCTACFSLPAPPRPAPPR